MAVTPLLCSQLLPVSDVAHVDAARRAVIRQASQLTDDPETLGRVTVVAQELARNLVNHAGEGELYLSHDGYALDMIAVDNGPGMSNVTQCISDHYSTKGTMGAGLGAIKRMSDQFDIFSLPQQGAVVFSRFQLQPAPAPSLFRQGAISTSHPKEEVCGDAWAVLGNRVMVCDGLGHGPLAHVASSKAREIFFDHEPGQSLTTLMERTHRALMNTRGGALAFAEIDAAQGRVTFCGVGNIAGVLVADRVRSMVSSNGTAGYKVGRIQAFTYPWDESTALIMSSDGINSRLSFEGYPGLLNKHPAVVAAVIHRDFKRTTDDATVLVIRA
ncbi:anti-sigma regulatory factor (Ser/Thr protein kinase) [Pseudomonas duriflava]|uniref:Anti-sigma regulatory factor (Ser/Thr protein kinase) n=1 Tax=Pseudomonas duriflava TaxID=459528 RepID=A0A562QPH6_9PSED|nr:SpoIIE family protein phosphatase [Pseudomonas duriflava]TWI58661.1 anti-sigma regulatory factor (Ser/Thr protein kinase) [Pseudomonas duriflava]